MRRRPLKSLSGRLACWQKSSLSISNGNCVEVAGLSDGEIGVRSSRDSQGPDLRFTMNAWHAILGGYGNGEFDSFGRKVTARATRYSVLPRSVSRRIGVEGLCDIRTAFASVRRWAVNRNAHYLSLGMDSVS